MRIFDFKYDGKYLSDFGLICCSFGGSSDSVEITSGADITLNQEKSSGSDYFDLYSTTYDEPFSITFSVCLNPCNDATYFTVEQVRQIQKWLCCRKYHKFKIIKKDYENIFWNGTFTAKQVVYNDEIIGLNLKFTADTSFALTEDTILDLSLIEAPESEFNVYGDINGYVNANYIITVKEDGDLQLDNYYIGDSENILDRSFTIKNCAAEEIITINGEKQIVQTNMPEHNLGKDCNFLLPRLINTYQTYDEVVRNKITSNLRCEVNITYNPTVMIGYGYMS